MIFTIVSCTVLVLVYAYCRHKNEYFLRRGVSSVRALPLLGSLGPVTAGRANFVDLLHDGYTAFHEDRYFGLYQYLVPTVVPRCLDLVRRLCTTDFSAFQDRGVHIDAAADPLFGRILIMLTGKKWKEMRSAISPAFTSSKVRAMGPLMADAARGVVRAWARRAHVGHAGHACLRLDVSADVAAYVNDVVASCALGLSVDSLAQPHNAVFELGQRALVQRTSQIIKLFAHENFPTIMKLLRVKIIDSAAAAQFRSLFLEAMRARTSTSSSGSEPRTQCLYRPDFIQTLVEAKIKAEKNKNKNDTCEKEEANGTEDKGAAGDVGQGAGDEELAAQAVLWYVAGFDTTAALLKFFLLEMAANPRVQHTLRQELLAVPYDAHDAQHIYDTIAELRYLDMTVSEVLRLWPAVGAADRRSVRAYDFGPPRDGHGDGDGPQQTFVAEAGVHVWLPIFSIQRDARYWPEPARCDPERFSERNRHRIVPYSYLPFGLGPRRCIGSRWAVLAAKVLVFHVLREWRVEPDERTPLPPQLCKRAFILTCKHGFWIKLVKITDST